MWRPAMVAGMLGATALLAAHPAAARNDEVFKVRAAISLPNLQKIQSFDISFVDPFLGGYFLADRTNATVDGVYVKTNQLTEQLKANFAGVGPTSDTSGPNGIITVHSNKNTQFFLWAGDYGNGSNGGTGGLVKVIDLSNGSLVATIATGGVARADELCLDPKDNVVLVANDAEPFTATGGGPYVTFIDSTNYKVLGQIVMNGQNGTPRATNGIEQCQYSRRTGMFYLNIPEVNGPGNDTAPGAVLVIDPTSRSIVNTFPLDHSQCEGPQGMAIGPQNQILIGCNDPNKDVPSTVIINERNGKTLAVVPNEDGSDQVWYNPGDGHYFLGESGGANPQHLGIIDALTGVSDISPQTGIKGGGTSHSVAADPITNKVFVPIAATAGAGVCSSVGGDDSVGCIAVFTANRPRHEVEGE
ncbi:MAG TPA: hypothetical protein VJ770_00265 [Stellaceae bacterium]|nr:hypothetical protein [Stellaceae bacterium]